MEVNLNPKGANLKAIMEAKKLADAMLQIAENGIITCKDDGCMQVYGAIRDCGYKIRKVAEQEQLAGKVQSDHFRRLH